MWALGSLLSWAGQWQNCIVSGGGRLSVGPSYVG